MCQPDVGANLGEPYVRPRTNNAFVPMYDGRTQGSPLHVLGTYVNEEFIVPFVS